ncbi:GEVED domain-containing protein [Salegentibacter flavus]|uniref:Por secretion system C-terminal sorting domain-containing protein n=1 Tax=Salegentibacter flavus TaxID=287099 RepID=A0A1I4XIA5_9FLAO|nr:GEVED domain-containing protein [Salegentibacter flavus]SFN25648.1 Por secretion system C-terminal sorting domain-containing protein [Salegentibacter flavus]
MKKILLLITLFYVFQHTTVAQEREVAGPAYIDSAQAVPSAAFSKTRLITPTTEYKLFNPRNRGINKIVPGKGLPRGEDPVRQSKMGDVKLSGEKKLNFEAVSTRATPSDPTGVAGPNHYVNAWNAAFSIFDKNGNQLTPPADLASIGGEFTNERGGDPIVVYDENADRYVISQMDTLPGSFLIAVSQGPDPVNSGWYTYRFPTNGMYPDYPKLSVWSDGYYFTTNKDNTTADQSEVIYVMERDKMLRGESAQVIGFPLPGIKTTRFYSPAAFHVNGRELPPPGNSPIIYMQDDSWEGVNEDHLKLWLVNVDWNQPGNSTISESQELGVAEGVSPFHSTFDGGSFKNLSQPFDAPDLDALQATMMYATQYRRFGTHNSVVMNFVVDIEPSAAEHAAVRWYELRQRQDGDQWQVYQEGTYAPDKSDRFGGSIAIDAEGNIGLGYTVLDDSPERPIPPSLRFTGRFEGDPRGVMTVEEESIIEGISPNPSFRYGDYSHMSVDAQDGLTFWYIGEVFEGEQRINQVGTFRIAPEYNNDLALTKLVAPVESTLGENEEIIIRIRNLGRNSQTDFEVSYSINGGGTITETVNQTLESTEMMEYTFSETVDLSESGAEYEITVSVNPAADENDTNNSLTETIRHLSPNDIGISSIDAPETGEFLDSTEEVVVTIENFGGMPQEGFQVSYQLGNNFSVVENFPGVLGVGEDEVFTFSETVDLSSSGWYEITASTLLETDTKPENDSVEETIVSMDCIPRGSDCSFGDGIWAFELGDILNENIPCGNGYIDFTDQTTIIDRSEGTQEVSVQTSFVAEEREQFSMWIDFNDNAVFEDSEMVIESQPLTRYKAWETFEFDLPQDAPLGQHLLRIRAGDTNPEWSGDLNSPCSVMQYGTTHDYTVTITDSTLDIDDHLLSEAEFVILSKDQKHFKAILETTYDQPLRISVYNILGQQMIENQIMSDGNAYVYEFDMSYAARGVYLVRVGTWEVGRVKRIIVK